MNRWIFPVALLWLSGCASTHEPAIPDVSSDAVTLLAEWIAPHAIEIELDGMQYRGDWSSRVCTTDACRGIFRNLMKIHRRHIYHGQAVLTAQSGSRLDCEWVSHLSKIDGVCRAQDGRQFKLKAGGAAPGRT